MRNARKSNRKPGKADKTRSLRSLLREHTMLSITIGPKVGLVTVLLLIVHLVIEGSPKCHTKRHDGESDRSFVG